MKYINKYKLNNKEVLIAGGLGLIGNEIVNACVDLGADVTVLDKEKNLKKNKLEKKYNYKSIDLSNSNGLKKFKNFISKKNFDVFVNSMYLKDKYWEKHSFDHFNINSFSKNIEINSFGIFLSSNLIAENMKKKNIKGSIILLNSIYGLVGQDMSVYKDSSIRENKIYSILKGGISNYVRQMASYYGKFNIRVNSICPGGIMDKNSKKLEKNKSFVNAYINKVPLKRFGLPQDVALLSSFLSSDASSYITGQNIPLDGGWTSI